MDKNKKSAPTPPQRPGEAPEGLSHGAWSSLQAAHTHWLHSFFESKEGFRTKSKTGGYVAAIDTTGFSIIPDSHEFEWGLDLVSFGCAGHEVTVGPAVQSSKDGRRLSRPRHPQLTEWFHNDPARGLEQGWTLHWRPEAGSGPVRLKLGIRGRFETSVEENGSSVTFRQNDREQVRYSELSALDAKHQPVPAVFESAVDGVYIILNDAGAAYPLSIDPVVRLARLTLGGSAQSYFGCAVAVSGDTVVVGAFGDDSASPTDPADNGAKDSGAAYVFQRAGSVWTQQAYLKAPNPGIGDWFGRSVAISGDIVVIGAPGEDSALASDPSSNSADSSGAAYVFQRTGSVWTQRAYLKASHPGAGDWFGRSVAVSGDIIVVGAYGEDSGSVADALDNSAESSGAAYVFQRTGSSWAQQAYLKAPNPGAGHRFGGSVALSGDTLSIGAAGGSMGFLNEPWENPNTSPGAVHIYQRTGGRWLHQTQLQASNPGLGDLFGAAVAISGDTVVVGAHGEDSRNQGNPENNMEESSGAAYVFQRVGSVWTQRAYLKAPDPGAGEWFGFSVAVSGDFALVGAVQDDHGLSEDPDPTITGESFGSVYLFQRTQDGWGGREEFRAPVARMDDWFGSSVALSSGTAVVGCLYEDKEIFDYETQDSGAAYVYQWTAIGDNWIQQADLKPPNTDPGDRFGYSVAVYGDTVAVGAYFESSGMPGNPADNSAPGSGAVFIYQRNGGVWAQQAYLKASHPGRGDMFGDCVAISGDIVVVGALYESSGLPSNPADNSMPFSGAAYVFQRTGSTWAQQGYLKASNLGTDDKFGCSVAVSGDTVVVGAYQEDSRRQGDPADNSASLSGAAYVFQRIGGNWIQQTYLKAPNPDENDYFGSSVAVSANTVVVGAPHEDSSSRSDPANNSMPSSGAAYVFQRIGSAWVQQAYLKASNLNSLDYFGGSVAISGDTVVVGASGEDSASPDNPLDNSAESSGAAYVFQRAGSAWVQQAYLKASNCESLDYFAEAVAVFGDSVVVGAPRESGGSWSSPSDNSAQMAGAAYVFQRAENNWTQQTYLKATNPWSQDFFGTSVAISGDIVAAGGLGYSEVYEIRSAGIPVIYHTHAGSITSPNTLGVVPQVSLPTGIDIYLPAAVRIEDTSGTVTRRVGLTPSSERTILAEGLTGLHEAFLFEDNSVSNHLLDPGERIIKVMVIRLEPFLAPNSASTVRLGAPIPPPDDIVPLPFAREVVTIGAEGQVRDLLAGPEAGFTVTREADGRLTNLVPRLPATGIHIAWRQLDQLGIAWPVRHVLYQVDFDEGPNPVLMARGSNPASAGEGLVLTPPSGWPANGTEVVFAAKLDDDTPLSDSGIPPQFTRQPVNGQITTTVPARLVVRFDPTPTNPASGDEVYQAVIAYPNVAPQVYDQITGSASIGTTIAPPAGTLYGKVVTGTRYAQTLPTGGGVYSESRQIIPVNTESNAEVWWHKVTEITIPGLLAPNNKMRLESPSVVRRYNFVWPEIPDTGAIAASKDSAPLGRIVIASQKGSGAISPSTYKDWGLYFQNDRATGGFNPNDEHAKVFAALGGGVGGQAIFPLRNDLGRATTSLPYVLMHYRDPADTDAAKIHRFKVWKVLAEGQGDDLVNYTFNYTGTAGVLIQPIYPVSMIQPGFPEQIAEGVSGPYFEDRKGQLWAKAAGNTGGNAVIAADWWYLNQAGFYYPPGVTPYSGAVPVPLLDEGTGNPRDISYMVSWPTVPSLQMGETLVGSKRGLPAIAGNESVQVIYEQGLTQTPAKDNVKLIDFQKEIKVDLDDYQLADIPSDVVHSLSSDGSYVVFGNLPPALAGPTNAAGQAGKRFYYDPTENQLRLRGVLMDPGLGEKYVLLNVITPRDRDLLLAPAFRGSNVKFQQALTALCDAAATVQEVPNGDYIKDPATALEFDSTGLAVTAGGAEAPGYITLAFNNDPDFSDSKPVSLAVIAVDNSLYRGTVCPITPESGFDEKITMAFDGDLAGLSGRYTFEWRSVAVSQLPFREDPESLPGGKLNVPWTDFGTGIGINGVNIQGAGLYTLIDNYFVSRYKPNNPAHPLYNQWSGWTKPALAEGWLKRAIKENNPFDQKFKSLSNPTVTVNTTVSMISQAGPRWEGNIPLTATGAANAGMIETYETVLRRGIGFSIDGLPAIDNPDANKALMLAAGRLADMYLLLGNEAYADAADPTIAVGQNYQGSPGSVFCFQGITGISSLLGEELGLLRGRDDGAAPGVGERPVYNRLIWNFNAGNGQTAYVNNYGLRDRNASGGVDILDARQEYPQGHGDAWGHYLTAVTNYYRLLRHPNFTWQSRSETINIGGVPVEVNYEDERKFAKAAAARAQTGAEIVGLTYRDAYKEDPEQQWRGYRDTTNAVAGGRRAWGVDEWGSRAGEGAYLDWAVGNAILPSSDTVNAGIQRVDRTTVTELRDLASSLLKVQTEVDKADNGLNPLGLMKNVMPLYELSAADVDAGKTLYEKSYEKTVTVLNNAIAVFNRADSASQQLRQQSDDLGKFQNTVDQQEMDYRNRLIEIYGYPYADDIGGGKTYPQDYDGPDVFHYMYSDPSQITGIDARDITTEEVKVEFKDYGLHIGQSRATLPVTGGAISARGVPVSENKILTFHLSTQGYGFIKPVTWTGTRRAPGQLQLAHSDLLQARARLDRSISEYDSLLARIEDRVALLGAQRNMNATEIQVLTGALQTQESLNDAIRGSRQQQTNFRTMGRIASSLANAVAEGFPTGMIVIAGLASGGGGDFTAPARSAVRQIGVFVEQAMSVAADQESIRELSQQQAKERAQSLTNITLTSLRQEQSVQQELAQIADILRQEASLRLEIFTTQEAMLQAAGRYKSTLAQGNRLLEERLKFRTRTAADVQGMRYRDMAFRIFRNDALEKYRAQFDMAAAWVYATARAYDYETNLLGDGSEPSGLKSGRYFLEKIVKARTLGTISGGVPLTGQNSGDGGLADPMALMKQTWDSYKGPLGFNQPENQTIRFSLRRELLRIPEGTRNDAAWRNLLAGSVVDNVLATPEFKRFCNFTPGGAREPALVIPFSTNVTTGLNFFGWPAGPGDNSYSDTKFATKIQRIGVWFSNYNVSALTGTPYAYLVPVGADVMRSPNAFSGQLREWRIVEQFIPPPLSIANSSGNLLSSLPAAWTPAENTLVGNEADVRRFSEMRAYPDGGFNAAQLNTASNTRLVGRSVWNTRWLLIIRGSRLFGSNPDEGIQRFINGQLSGGQRDGQGVKDILLNFQTYSVDGF